MNFRQVIPLHMESNEKDVRVPVLTQTRTAEAIRVPLGAIFRVCMMVGVHVHGLNQIGRLVYANTRHDHMHDMVCPMCRDICNTGQRRDLLRAFLSE